MKSKASVTLVQFRIDVDFPKADVDVVLREMATRGVTTPVPSILTDGAQIPIDETKLDCTPSKGSVDFCLNVLWGFADEQTLEIKTGRFSSDPKSPLEKSGIDVKSIYGLMQGTCHLMCEVAYEDFNQELVDKATAIAQEVFDKYCIYYDYTLPACVIQEDADFELRAYDVYGNVLGEDFRDYDEAVMRMWLLGYRPAQPHEEEDFKLPAAA
ncbi:MAG: hypothetical protein P8J32_04705 [bacterium]|nr:hypothetical protein [bacterium]